MRRPHLMRQVNFGIPSGQTIARNMGVQALTPATGYVQEI